MSRPPSPLVAPRHEGLRQRIRALKAEPPCWGDRRMWASLPCGERRAVHTKRMWRVMRAHPRLLTPTRRLRAPRPPPGTTPRPTMPQVWWGMADDNAHDLPAALGDKPPRLLARADHLSHGTQCVAA
jgi:hypothetical protein